MAESRCGLLCSQCEFRASMGCGMCVNSPAPFHGACAVKNCCEEKGLEYCGTCSQFPCQLLKEYAYDPEHGDNGARIIQCQNWRGEA